MKKALSFLAMIVLPASAYAQCAVDTPYTLNSWHDVVSALRSNGIDAGRVNWGPVEQLCQFYRKSHEPNAYNNCRFTKARDSILFASDRAQCHVQAVAAVPRSLARKGTIERIKESDRTGVVRQYDRSVRPYTQFELNAERDSVMIACMQSFGWQDANDWTLGKRCE